MIDMCYHENMVYTSLGHYHNVIASRKGVIHHRNLYQSDTTTQ